MAYYIDTHVHLYDEAFGDEVDEVVGRSLEAGVGMMIQPDVDGKERSRMIEITERHGEVMRCMLGLYPGSVDEGWEKEVEEIRDMVDRVKPVGIGEIGLDYHYSADSAELQKKAFAEQLRMASELSLPVNVHLRDAAGDFFRVMEENRHLEVRGNLHAFSGSPETFRRLRKMGDWYVGIGGVITFRNSRLAEAVKEIPLDRIVLETDAPYLTPVPYRGKRNDSSHIPLIAAKIAQVKGVSVEEVAEVTTDNAKKLFNLR